MAISDAPRASEPKASINRCDLIRLPFISIPPFELFDDATSYARAALVFAAFPDLLPGSDSSELAASMLIWPAS